MADKTAKFESAQALFCAIADGVGKANIDKVLNLKEYETYPEFKKAHGKKIKDAQNHIDTTADIKEIELSDVANLTSTTAQIFFGLPYC